MVPIELPQIARVQALAHVPTVVTKAPGTLRVHQAVQRAVVHKPSVGQWAATPVRLALLGRAIAKPARQPIARLPIPVVPHSAVTTAPGMYKAAPPVSPVAHAHGVVTLRMVVPLLLTQPARLLADQAVLHRPAPVAMARFLEAIPMQAVRCCHVMVAGAPMAAGLAGAVARPAVAAAHKAVAAHAPVPTHHPHAVGRAVRVLLPIGIRRHVTPIAAHVMAAGQAGAGAAGAVVRPAVAAARNHALVSALVPTHRPMLVVPVARALLRPLKVKHVTPMRAQSMGAGQAGQAGQAGVHVHAAVAVVRKAVAVAVAAPTLHHPVAVPHAQALVARANLEPVTPEPVQSMVAGVLGVHVRALVTVVHKHVAVPTLHHPVAVPHVVAHLAAAATHIVALQWDVAVTPVAAVVPVVNLHGMAVAA